MKIARNSRQRISRGIKALVAVAACAIVLGAAAAAEACPMCKTALGSGADAHINAWGASIVFMLSMPFLLVGSFSIYMYVLVRRARAEQDAKQAISAPESAREAALVE